jgi:hypothetical protein
MSALGQKRTSVHARVISALPPKADIAKRDCHVRFVPEADKCNAPNEFFWIGRRPAIPSYRA